MAVKRKLHKLPRTIKKVAKLEAISKGKTSDGTNEIFLCPFCLEKERAYPQLVKDPKADEHGKLYMLVSGDAGYCFRCNTIVFSNWTVDSSFDRLLGILNSFNIQLELPDLPDLKVDHYPNISQVPKAMEWIRKKNPAITPYLAKALDFRWVDFRKRTIVDGKPVDSRRQGILVPFNWEGGTKSYQIRYLTDDKRMRFYTKNGLRLLYVPFPIEMDSEITICEGPRDAVACWMLGYPNVVSLQGSSLSEFQSMQLREFVPYKVNLCLDDVECNKQVARDLKKKVPTVVEVKFHYFDWQDPEEYLLGKLRNKDFFRLEGLKYGKHEDETN